MVENRRAILLLLSVLLFMTPSILAPEESISPIPETTAAQPEIDYNNYYSLSGVPFDQWDLEKIDWSDPSFYASPAFDVIGWEDERIYSSSNFIVLLQNIPPEFYARLDGEQVVQAGYGQDLNAGQIEENIDEIPDLNKLNHLELDSFLQKEYGIENINVKSCQENSCTLVGGVLKNHPYKGQSQTLHLSVFRDTLAKITADDKGRIYVLIDELGEEAKNTGAYKTLDKPTTPLSSDRFYLKIGQSISQVGFWVKNAGGQLNLQFGDFYFDAGTVYIPPITRDNGFTIVNNLQIKVFGKENLKLAPKPQENVFSKELYLDDEKLIATGNDYQIIFLKDNNYVDNDLEPNLKKYSLIEDKPLELEGQRFFAIKPQGSSQMEIPAKITILKQTGGEGNLLPPKISIVGRTEMQNGWTIINTDGGHFISLPSHTIESNTPHSPPLVDMELYFEKDQENRLLVQENRIKVGGQKTTYLSIRYNEEGRVNIDLQLGELEKGKVKKPALFVYTPFSNAFDPLAKKNPELEVWKAGMDLIQFNKDEETIPITIFLGNDYSPKTGAYHQNERYLTDFISAAETLDIPITFLGHSAIDYGSQTAYILANGEEESGSTPTAEQLANPQFVREYLENSPRSARLPLSLFDERSRDNPVFCGCASGSLLHEADKSALTGISGIEELSGPHGEPRFLTGDESLAVIVYSTMRIKRGPDYNWKDFKNDWDAGKVYFPTNPQGCNFFASVKQGLETINTGVHDWGGHPMGVCID